NTLQTRKMPTITMTSNHHGARSMRWYQSPGTGRPAFLTSMLKVELGAARSRRKMAMPDDTSGRGEFGERGAVSIAERPEDRFGDGRDRGGGVLGEGLAAAREHGVRG